MKRTTQTPRTSCARQNAPWGPRAAPQDKAQRGQQGGGENRGLTGQGSNRTQESDKESWGKFQ